MPVRTVLPEPEQTGRQQRHRKRQYDKNGSYDPEQQCISLPFCFGVTVIIPYNSPADKMPAVIKSVTNVTVSVTDGTFPFRGGYDMIASESNISHLKLQRRSGIIGFGERAVTMKRQNMIMYRALRLIFKPLFSVLYRCEIIGKEHIPAEGAAVIAGNHTHALDPILVDICTKRVVCTLAKKALHDGAFGFLFRAAGTIPVDLHSAHNPDALKAAEEALRSGLLVNVSPEAKRNYTDELLLPFKFGAAVMSQRTGAPVVPYAVCGTYKPFRGKVTIRFGEPILPEGRTPDEINRVLYDRIAELLDSIMPADLRSKKRLTSYDAWREGT